MISDVTRAGKRRESGRGRGIEWWLGQPRRVWAEGKSELLT